MTRPDDHKPLRPPFVIPFGRVLARNDGDPPVNEVMIGHEAERAYFINLLVSRGPTGAYLITGRRGVGKTSFVRHCLNEYGAALFKRFLRNNAGKSVWDFTLLAMISGVLIVAALLMSGISNIFITTIINSYNSWGDQAILKATPLLVIALSCTFICISVPLTYARQIFDIYLRFEEPISRQDYNANFWELCQSIRSDANKRSFYIAICGIYWQKLAHHASAVASLLCITLMILGWLYLPDDPVLVLSRYFLVLCALYAAIQHLSYEKYDDPIDKNKEKNEEKNDSHRRFRRWAWFIAVLVLTIYFLPSEINLTDFQQRWLGKSWFTYQQTMAPGHVIAIGFLLLFHGNATRVIIYSIGCQRSLVKYAMKGNILYYTAFAIISIVCFILSLFLVDPQNLSSAWQHLGLPLVIVSSCLLLDFYRRHNTRRIRHQKGIVAYPQHFRPSPRMLLFLKAGGAILIALQLGYPAFSAAQWQLFQRVDLFQNVNLQQFAQERWCHGGPNIATLFCAATGMSNVKEPHSNNGNIFQDETGKQWGLLLFIILALFFLVEYDWTVRPFINDRGERSLEPGTRAPWDDQRSSDVKPHERFHLRQLERMTFPAMAYAVWLPTLTVTVNLGFDKLDHRSVIHAMLVGLRGAYQHLFLSWRSCAAFFVRVVGVIGLLFLTAQLGQAWFELPGDPERGTAGDPTTQKFREKSLETWREIDEFRHETPSSNPSVGLVDTVMGNPENIIYKKHPEDVHDRYCRYYLFMSRWEMKEYHATNGNSRPEYYQHYPSPALRLLCSFENSDILLSTLYFTVIPAGLPVAEVQRSWPLSMFIHANAPLPFEPEGRMFDLRIYHILIFVSVFLIGRWALFWFPMLPYRKNLRRIDDLLDALSSRTVTRRGTWKPAQWLSMVLGDGGNNEIEREPMESRAIELAVLDILREIQRGTFTMVSGRVDILSIPAPEITFVFDELDKLGVVADTEEGPRANDVEDIALMNAERQRSIALHRLMSDLKRLLSAAPARFIFVGGRQLHDEWLADQTSRQPLSTSIFNAEIYLPSLLTDHELAHLLRKPVVRPRALHDRLKEYVALQHERSLKNMEAWTTSRFRPAFGHDMRWEQHESFYQPSLDQGYSKRIDTLWQELRVINPFAEHDEQDKAERPLWAENFLNSFIRFLTYRSVGNPKRLRELLYNFLEPTGRVVPDRLRWSNPRMACLDVLYFLDDDIFRVQMIDIIYRHIIDRFGSQLARRDDKIAVSLFYITDFLFKFHRRAFAWSNLERIEELVHIHRAPDLRRMLEELVEHGAGRFLHRVLNGMYAFRFRSDISCEIEYLSRRSEEDLAAFNFTLDESQSLKRLYLWAARSDAGNAEIQSGLGELFEFDEEYETARHYYRQAIVQLDEKLDRFDPGISAVVVAGPARPKLHSVFGEMLGGTAEGKDIATAIMSWGLSRLRLMLQIGMTYELSRNTERAETEYRDAYALSERLFDAYLDGLKALPTGPTANERLAQRLNAQNALINQNLIYQAPFAIAWLAEKLMGNIDDSLSIVEGYIDRLRVGLPFVNEPKLRDFKDGERGVHSNFALVMAELHRKAGDLYFFKGKQFIIARRINKYTQLVINDVTQPPAHPSQEERPHAPGFLLRADYHYAIGLHELQRHSQSRRLGSKRWNTGPKAQLPTIHFDKLPGLMNLAIGMALSGFADSILSRASLFGLLRWVFVRPGATSDEVEAIKHADRKVKAADGAAMKERSFQWIFSFWFYNDVYKLMAPNDKDEEHAKRVEVDIYERINDHYYISMNDIYAWIGKWEGDNKNNYPKCPIQMRMRHNFHERLLMALTVSRTSAGYFRDGGYYNEAAHKRMKSCETVCTTFWWIAGVRNLSRLVRDLERGLSPGQAGDQDYDDILKILGFETPQRAFNCRAKTIHYLLELEKTAFEALGEAAQDFEAAMRGRDGVDQPARGYLRGGNLPPAVLTAACSLFLSFRAALGAPGDIRWPEGIPADISEKSRDLWMLIETLTGHELPRDPKAEEAWVRDVLTQSLQRNRYPVLNQLNVFNVLIQSELVFFDQRALSVNDLRRVGTYLQEWLDLIDAYNAPLQFPPLFTGTALVWFCLTVRRAGLDNPRIRISAAALAEAGTPVPAPEELGDEDYLTHFYWRFRRAASRHLEKAQQLHTMGAAYYEEIAKLNYLYDDFNDRHIHFYRALQMAGMDLNAVLLSDQIHHLLGSDAAAAITGNGNGGGG